MKVLQKRFWLIKVLIFVVVYFSYAQQNSLYYTKHKFLTDQQTFTPLNQKSKNHPSTNSSKTQATGYKFDGSFIWPSSSSAADKYKLITPQSFEYCKYDGEGFKPKLAATLEKQGFTKTASFRIYYSTEFYESAIDDIFRSNSNTEIEELVIQYAILYIPKYEHCTKCFISYEKIFINEAIDDRWSSSSGWGYETKDPNTGKTMRGKLKHSGGSIRNQKSYLILATIYKNYQVSHRRKFVSNRFSPVQKHLNYNYPDKKTDKPKVADKKPTTTKKALPKKDNSKELNRRKKEMYTAARSEWTAFMRKKHGKNWKEKWNNKWEELKKWKVIFKYNKSPVCTNPDHFIGVKYVTWLKKDPYYTFFHEECRYYKENPYQCRE